MTLKQSILAAVEMALDAVPDGHRAIGFAVQVLSVPNCGEGNSYIAATHLMHEDYEPQMGDMLSDFVDALKGEINKIDHTKEVGH